MSVLGLLCQNLPTRKKRPVELVGELMSGSNIVADILLIDGSGSMSKGDYYPSRMTAALGAIREFVECSRSGHPRRKIGIVVYSNSAYEVLHVKSAGDVSEREIRSVLELKPSGPTNQVSGLETAWQMLRRVGAGEGSRFILLTDGWATTGGDPVPVAVEIKDKGVQLNVIGIGGCPGDVNEGDLKRMASIVDGKTLYWFIDSAPKLVEQYRGLSLRSFE